MKKLFLFAAIAGFGLCSGALPDQPRHQAREARTGYPACSRTVTDNCIQLHERGVRRRDNLAHNQPAASAAAAAAAPAAAAPAPVQTAQAAPAGASGCRCAHPRRHLSRRVRHAGERG